MFEYVTQHPFGAILLLALLLSASACVHYTVHTGALNKTDSAAYDALLIAESAIDQARIDYAAKQLPDSTKTALDALIHAYNVAHESWLTYRGAISTNVPSDAYFSQLNKNITDLSTAIRTFKEAQ